ncbi:MAG: hypothetical protein UY13_C0002G0352 [Candidatus Pacebacteria bacterium GW2011_GWB1_47_8]|nr:MAG: hypothetical protein UX28_C0001G0500 [Candidatus Pacebacteria bacterium GW2011_GWA1_46_10]KKU84440.1 MAG: hypothetical protein UY13_C0002G0352 [Candidatus Pacebacteria bacterium GW2011_GWB1_47_8]
MLAGKELPLVKTPVIGFQILIFEGLWEKKLGSARF